MDFGERPEPWEISHGWEKTHREEFHDIIILTYAGDGFKRWILPRSLTANNLQEFKNYKDMLNVEKGQKNHT